MIAPAFLLTILPALALGAWAQYRVRSTYADAERMPAQLSGAAAARQILDSAGLDQVGIEPTPGRLTDHYDPRCRVLRLSDGVYRGRTLAALGIAAHEAGHAMQHAGRYAPLVIRNAAVPAASFGSGVGMLLLALGIVLGIGPLLWLGIGLFGCVVFFQIVNLPVEFNASRRAKAQLAELGLVGPEEMVCVDRVLSAAALTYVAATLQAILTLQYYVSRARRRSA